MANPNISTSSGTYRHGLTNLAEGMNNKFDAINAVMFRRIAKSTEIGEFYDVTVENPDVNKFTYLQPYVSDDNTLMRFVPLYFKMPEGVQDDDYNWFSEVNIDYVNGTDGRVYKNNGNDRLVNLNIILQLQFIGYGGDNDTIEDLDSNMVVNYGLYDVSDRVTETGEYDLTNLVDPTKIISFTTYPIAKRCNLNTNVEPPETTYSNVYGGFSDIMSSGNNVKTFQICSSVVGLSKQGTSMIVFVRCPSAFQISRGVLSIETTRA